MATGIYLITLLTQNFFMLTYSNIEAVLNASSQ